MFRRLKKKGVYITPANIFYLAPNEGQDSFKISFYQVNGEKIRKGMELLKEEILLIDSEQLMHNN